MARRIEDIEGIGLQNAALLKGLGIDTTDELLEAGGTRTGRQKLADMTHLSDSLILKWVNMSDLFRIHGVASQYAELLEGSGVDTVKELRNRNAANLAAKMAEINEVKHLCKVTPSEKMVSRWVTEAQNLEPMVSY